MPPDAGRGSPARWFPDKAEFRKTARPKLLRRVVLKRGRIAQPFRIKVHPEP
jgi:hypothetical protein